MHDRDDITFPIWKQRAIVELFPAPRLTFFFAREAQAVGGVGLLG
ncbi:hypothetical protein KOAAANKH_03243 [Brevundimonas sp. NIBR10]|nr:hypothetical protein KOAAANKH_03243 [Brevundimonas sp. NIBR10]